MKYFFIIGILLFPISLASATSFPKDEYIFFNESNYPIIVNVTYKDIVHEGAVINYYENNKFINNIHIGYIGNFNKDIIPSKEKSTIFLTEPYYYIVFNQEKYSYMFGTPEEERLYLPGNNEENVLPPTTVFHCLIQEFTVCDIEGNLIMTLDDITDSSFTIIDEYNKLIILTQEIVETGKQKYAGTVIN
jgi:hypothetical protein